MSFTIELEYEQIKNKLEEFMNQRKISEYTKCTIIDMSNNVLEYTAKKFENIRNGVKSITCSKNKISEEYNTLEFASV